MDDEDEGPQPRYAIVENAERMYSLWPEGRPPPDGWTPVGVAGTRAEALAWIEAHWNIEPPETA